MKKNPEYYTPSIEEFHPGFEYEISNYMLVGTLRIRPKEEWFKEVFNNHSVYKLDLIEYILKMGTEKIVRVKYLDKADIKELGITLNEWFISKGDIGGTWKITAPGLESSPTIYIHSRDFIRNGSGDYTTSVMRFKIKNISELKVILKQVGITK